MADHCKSWDKKDGDIDVLAFESTVTGPSICQSNITKQGGPVPASGHLSLPCHSTGQANCLRDCAHLQDSDLGEHHLPCNYRPKEKVLSSLWHEQTLESDTGFKFHTLHFAFHQTSTGGLWQWSSDAGYNAVLIISMKMKGVKKKIMSNTKLHVYIRQIWGWNNSKYSSVFWY